MRPGYLLILAVVLVAGASGVAYARTSGSATDDVIHACVMKHIGIPRIVSGPEKCRRTETPLSWNGEGSGTLPTEAWYTNRELDDVVSIPITPPPAGQPVPLLTLDLPSPPEGGGYLLNVTFGLRNTGPVDAELVCHVGNIMAHQFFAPVSDQTAGQELLGGVFGSDTRTYSVTGVYTGGGTTGLHCGIINWTTQGQAEEQLPSVELKGAILTAQRIDQLTQVDLE